MAPSEEIANRRLIRNAQGIRISDTETIEQIEHHQRGIIRRISSLTKRSGAAFATVFNEPLLNESNIAFLRQLLSIPV